MTKKQYQELINKYFWETMFDLEVSGIYEVPTFQRKKLKEACYKSVKRQLDQLEEEFEVMGVFDDVE